jgi:hypothetical protein
MEKPGDNPAGMVYAMQSADRSEQVMTSEINVEHVVERQVYFTCPCGATIVASAKNVTCAIVAGPSKFAG